MVAAEALGEKLSASDEPLPAPTEGVTSLASGEDQVVNSPILSPAGNGSEVPTPLAHPEVPPAEPQISVGDEYTAPQSGSYSPEGGPVVHEELDGEETEW